MHLLLEWAAMSESTIRAQVGNSSSLSSCDEEKEMATEAAAHGHLDILIYFVEERKISDVVKHVCMCNATRYGRLDCLKYLLGEEAKAPLNDWRYIALARHYEHPECVNYLLEKGSPEPTDEQYATFAESLRALESRQENSE